MMCNIWSIYWGESEDKVIEAMKVIKDYCEHKDICNACPMFLTCTQIGGKKTWEIEDMRGEKNE